MNMEGRYLRMLAVTQTNSLGTVAAVDIGESRNLQPTVADVKMPLFMSSNDNDDETRSTPENAPFSLIYDDLKSLKPDAFVLGKEIDAMFVIVSAMLFNHNGTKVYIMPALFFSQIDSDISLESLIPRDFVDVAFIIGAFFFSHHWCLVLVDCTKEHIFYLDPIITRYVPIQKINADLAVIRTIIWYCVMNNSLDVPVLDKLPNWIIVDHQSFLVCTTVIFLHKRYLF